MREAESPEVRCPEEIFPADFSEIPQIQFLAQISVSVFD